ncbi:Phosphosulfolactate phosphohydrolase and related enzymes [Tatumella ptyseos]|uniref:Phosphosulfolactate phosphohydrolase and related enzymes n=1 Tax=Tatumella ptyseos TaxID=82987 RepID=A0A2X5NRZ0_9GAMM|nr:Phosphosulfolactate phosphohydrolase and related enzymes [Tatumella ptyseos]
MHCFSQATFDVRLEWGMPAIDYLAADADCIVIIDVMSFSTCVSVAIDNGARIYPYLRKDASATEYGEKRGPLLHILKGDTGVRATHSRRFHSGK